LPYQFNINGFYTIVELPGWGAKTKENTLVKAVEQLNVDEVKWLLENGANPNVFGHYIPLFESIASYNKNDVLALQIFSLLLEYLFYYDTRVANVQDMVQIQVFMKLVTASCPELM
jgi:hypothetical protein